tara:strand:- start:70 stop:981 length:912 start_codon:yes stop_codon:yes gene_type:complete
VLKRQFPHLKNLSIFPSFIGMLFLGNFAVAMPRPISNLAKKKFEPVNTRAYQDLIQNIAVYGQDERKLTDSENTRATMRVFCVLPETEKGEDGTEYASLLGVASLTGPKQISTASHVITPKDNCKEFHDLTKCYVQETVTKEFFRFRAETVKGKPNCINRITDVGSDEIRIKIETAPRGIRHYDIGDGKNLKVGDRLTVVATQAYNFMDGDINHNKRIIQTCKVLKVEAKKNRLRTDCDTGAGQSGAILLNDRWEAVGVLSADYNVGDKKVSPKGLDGVYLNPDGLEAEVNTNFSVFTILKAD